MPRKNWDVILLLDRCEQRHFGTTKWVSTTCFRTLIEDFESAKPAIEPLKETEAVGKLRLKAKMSLAPNEKFFQEGFVHVKPALTRYI